MAPAEGRPEGQRRGARGRRETGPLPGGDDIFLLSAYITYEAVGALLARKGPDSSSVGLMLAAISLLVMPTLAYLKGSTGREMGSEAL